MPQTWTFTDPGEGIHEAEVLEVKASPGDTVEEGQTLLVVETDKASIELPVPFSGTIDEIHVQKGDDIEVGDTLMSFKDGASDKDEDAEHKAAKAKKAEPKEAKDKKKKKKKEKKEKKKARQEKRDEEETAKQAKEAEPEAEAEETEEAEETKKAEGKEAKQEKRAPAKQAEEEEAKQTKEEEEKQTEEEESAREGQPVPASPSTRRLARELGVALERVEGSGPGGRVTAEDVRAFAEEGEEKETPEAKREKKKQGKEAKEAKREKEDKAEQEDKAEKRRKQKHKRKERATALPAQPKLPDFSRWGPIREEPLRSIRRKTAERMALSWTQIPHVMHGDVADITELEVFRRQHKAGIEEQGGSLSLTVLILKAVAAVLRQFPRFNASIDMEEELLIFKEYCHIGVAVDTEQGLLVPVLRDVDRKSIVELAQELPELVKRTQEGKLSRENMQGGCFTITNPGPLGGTTFTPLINYPEVAILGLGKVCLQPVTSLDFNDLDQLPDDLSNVEIRPRLQLPLRMSYDHRVNDGADAARFINALVEILKDPERLLLNA